MDNSKFLALMADENANVTLSVSSDNLRTFATFLVNSVRGEFQSMAPSRQEAEKEPEDRLLSRKEACDYLGICPTTMWKWTKEGVLTAVQSATKLKYRKSDLDRILNGGIREPE